MKRRVVVTGMGCISPLGNDLKSTWEACREGKSGIGPITRFDPSPFRCHIAGEVRDFEMPSIIPPKDVKKMGKFIHYVVAATQEALGHASFNITEALQESVGVIFGVGIGGLDEIESQSKKLYAEGNQKISPFFIPETLINMAAGQVSLLFGAKNYSAGVVSACSSSNHAIGDAARLIAHGDADVMIAGGSESAVTPLGIGGFSSMRALSTRNDEPTKASRPYDRDRDGFVLAEGAAVLILEELEFAKARGATIYAEITGYGFSSDAYHMTAPSLEGPVRAMKMAMRNAQVTELDYINAHGTSTPAGDINELNAIHQALGDNAAKAASISSTKSMTGHLLGAAGAIEAVLTIQSMVHDWVLPTINIENLDPDCHLDVTPNEGKSRSIQTAMSNSFGFGGTNASLVFQKHS